MTEPPDDRVFHGPNDYLDLARSTGVTVAELRDLARSPYSFVVQAVAEHPETPLEVLRSLIPENPRTGNDFALVIALIRHPRADEALLSAVAGVIPLRSLREERNPQQVFAAAIALFEQPRTPEPVLLSMLTDEHATTEFRKVAARQTTHQAIVDQLLTDRSETVRRAAQRRSEAH